MPFYYCFPQTYDISLRDTANKIAFKLLQQAVGFITKNREFLEEEVLFYLLEEKNYPWLKKLTMYWNINKRERQTCLPSLILEKTWKLAKILSSIFSKKTLIIIDEYQKTVEDLLDDNGNPVRCSGSIGEIINNRNIYTMISGSQTSMLAYEVLTSEIHNRIPGEKFDPLPETEAHELIRQYTRKNGYKGIEQDVYQLTGGNPYYIKVIFSPTNKFCKYFKRDKMWRNKKDIEDIYNFEMLHMEGEVFLYWRKHINEKLHLLNNDPPQHKGATIRLLKYIAEKDNAVHIEELKKKFPEITDMRERLTKLRETDLILDSVDSEEIMNFSDHVLPVVMTKMYQKIILGTISKAAFDSYQENWFKTLEKRIHEHYEQTEKTVKNVQSSVNKLKKDKKIRSKTLQTI